VSYPHFAAIVSEVLWPTGCSRLPECLKDYGGSRKANECVEERKYARGKEKSVVDW
jgi:hypothetical protein